MKKYRVKDNLRTNGRLYRPGEYVKLTSKEAERLLELKVIEGPVTE